MTQQQSFILGDGEKITKLVVRHGGIVDSIGFVVTDKNGGNSTKFISNGLGGDPSEIVLGPEEYITRVSGTYGTWNSFNGLNYITSITIYTNSNQYGPFGNTIGTTLIESFSTPQPLNGTIVGFFGSSDSYVTSIGVYAKSGPYGRTS